MKYLEKKFSVGSPGTSAYAAAWERIFGGSPEVSQGCKSGSACAPTSTPVGEGVEGTPGVGVGGCRGEWSPQGPGGGVGLPGAPDSHIGSSLSEFLADQLQDPEFAAAWADQHATQGLQQPRSEAIDTKEGE